MITIYTIANTYCLQHIQMLFISLSVSVQYHNIRMCYAVKE